MTSIVIHEFGGMIPRSGDEFLPDIAATQASNCVLLSGELRPLHAPSLVYDFFPPRSHFERLPPAGETPPAPPQEDTNYNAKLEEIIGGPPIIWVKGQFGYQNDGTGSPYNGDELQGRNGIITGLGYIVPTAKLWRICDTSVGTSQTWNAIVPDTDPEYPSPYEPLTEPYPAEGSTITGTVSDAFNTAILRLGVDDCGPVQIGWPMLYRCVTTGSRTGGSGGTVRLTGFMREGNTPTGDGYDSFDTGVVATSSLNFVMEGEVIITSGQSVWTQQSIDITYPSALPPEDRFASGVWTFDVQSHDPVNGRLGVNDFGNAQHNADLTWSYTFIYEAVPSGATLPIAVPQRFWGTSDNFNSSFGLEVAIKNGEPPGSLIGSAQITLSQNFVVVQFGPDLEPGDEVNVVYTRNGTTGEMNFYINGVLALTDNLGFGADGASAWVGRNTTADKRPPLSPYKQVWYIDQEFDAQDVADLYALLNT